MSKYRFEIYPDRAGKTRFRFRHANGKIMFDSGESFHSDGNARRAVKSIRKAVADAEIVVIKGDDNGAD